MRATLKILTILLASLLSSQATAQVSAVMQAKVEIISGAALTAPDHSIVDLSSVATSEFEALNFSLTAAPSTEVDITFNQNSDLKNESGQVMDFEDLHLKQEDEGNGNHAVSILGKLKDGQELNGKYQGSFTAVVEYL
ncbi:MAG TPA: hypothetical protein DD671_10220 [Balneolaceae bacterium]|nr:hypothetical protein [Balneolaceae bacterium]